MGGGQKIYFFRSKLQTDFYPLKSCPIESVRPAKWWAGPRASFEGHSCFLMKSLGFHQHGEVRKLMGRLGFDTFIIDCSIYYIASWGKKKKLSQYRRWARIYRPSHAGRVLLTHSLITIDGWISSDESKPWVQVMSPSHESKSWVQVIFMGQCAQSV